jgi:hypothetical protein
MTRILTAVQDFGDRTVKVKWVAPAYVLIGLIAFFYGHSVIGYARDQRDAAAKDNAAAVYAAESASYENARDEQIRCEQRVDSRDQLRGVFLSIFDLIEERSPRSDFVVDATARLDIDYPPLSVDDCPVIPTPPIRPGG